MILTFVTNSRLKLPTLICETFKPHKRTMPFIRIFAQFKKFIIALFIFIKSNLNRQHKGSTILAPVVVPTTDLNKHQGHELGGRGTGWREN